MKRNMGTIDLVVRGVLGLAALMIALAVTPGLLTAVWIMIAGFFFWEMTMRFSVARWLMRTHSRHAPGGHAHGSA